MKIRRFIASDIREAMRQVREALGPDAVILETQRIEGGIELSRRGGLRAGLGR